MTRDFVGYGATPPHAHWPGEARIAVNFVINFEEGSELSYPEGDGVSETGLIEGASTDAGNRRDLAAESMFEYGARVGWWRLHRIFTQFRLPVTLFACARALAANPPAAAAIAATDWDICGHGYRWIKHYELAEAEERDQIQRAVALIRETTASRPMAGIAATPRPRIRGASSSRMAAFSTTATPITMNFRIGCAKAASRISSSPIRSR